MDYAHERGIVHRDLKPQNVLLDEKGNAFITDFGLARLIEGGTAITQSGAIMGTPLYMSPEQWLGMQLDARSDVYSLGVMLFEMLSGQAPFHTDTPIAMLNKTVHEPPPPIRAINPALPTEIDPIIRQALAKTPMIGLRRQAY